MQISNLHLADQYTVTMVIFEGVNYGELGAAGYAHALYSYKGKKQVQATFLVHAHVLRHDITYCVVYKISYTYQSTNTIDEQKCDTITAYFCSWLPASEHSKAVERIAVAAHINAGYSLQQNCNTHVHTKHTPLQTLQHHA